jgi:hypothetical protein
MRTVEWISSSGTSRSERGSSTVIDTVGGGSLQGLHTSLEIHSDGALVGESLMKSGNLTLELIHACGGGFSDRSRSWFFALFFLVIDLHDIVRQNDSDMRDDSGRRRRWGRNGKRSEGCGYGSVDDRDWRHDRGLW